MRYRLFEMGTVLAVGSHSIASSQSGRSRVDSTTTRPNALSSFMKKREVSVDHSSDAGNLGAASAAGQSKVQFAAHVECDTHAILVLVSVTTVTPQHEYQHVVVRFVAAADGHLVVRNFAWPFTNTPATPSALRSRVITAASVSPDGLTVILATADLHIFLLPVGAIVGLDIVSRTGLLDLARSAYANVGGGRAGQPVEAKGFFAGLFGSSDEPVKLDVSGGRVLEPNRAIPIVAATKQHRGEVAAFVVWWRVNDGSDIAIIATQRGVLSFVHLRNHEEVLVLRLKGIITAMSLLNEAEFGSKYLLLSIASDHNAASISHFRLPLEKESIGSPGYETVITCSARPDFGFEPLRRFVGENRAAVFGQPMPSTAPGVAILKTDSNVLEIFDFELNRFPLYIYQLPYDDVASKQRSNHVVTLMTKRLIFSSASVMSNRSNHVYSHLFVVSKLLAGARAGQDSSNAGPTVGNGSHTGSAGPTGGGNGLGGTTDNARLRRMEAVIESFRFPEGETILYIFPDRASQVASSMSNVVSFALPTIDNANQSGSSLARGEEEAESSADLTQSTSSANVSPVASTVPSLADQRVTMEGCLVVTTGGVYRVSQCQQPARIFLDLVSKKIDAEPFGKSVGLDLHSLYEYAADRYFQAGELQRAFELYKLSNVSVSKLLSKFIAGNQMVWVMGHLRNILNRPSSLTANLRKKLSGLMFGCYMHQVLEATVSGDGGLSRAETEDYFSKFITDNWDYNQTEALLLLENHDMQKQYLRVAEARGLVPQALNILLNRGRLCLDAGARELLESGQHHSFVCNCGDGALVRSMRPYRHARFLLQSPQLLLSRCAELRQLFAQLDVETLVMTCRMFDPTKSKFRSLLANSFPNTDLTLNDPIVMLQQAFLAATKPPLVGSRNARPASQTTLLSPQQVADIRTLVETFLLGVLALANLRGECGVNTNAHSSALQIMSPQRRSSIAHHAGDPFGSALGRSSGGGGGGGGGKRGRPSSKRPAFVIAEKAEPPTPNTSSCSTVLSTGVTHAALVRDGDCFTWGLAQHGRLGHGDITVQDSPVLPLRVETLRMAGMTVRSVACGSEHTLALCDGGHVYSWGRGEFGQLGHGNTVNKTRPEQIMELTNGEPVRSIAAGQYHSLAVLSDGTLMGWGWNMHGQLGSTMSACEAVRVGSVGSSNGLGSGLTRQRSLTRVEDNLFTEDTETMPNAQLRDRSWSMTTSSQAASVDVLTPQPFGELTGTVVTTACAGYCHTVVLTAQGRVHTFGSNIYGQLGRTETDADRAIGENGGRRPVELEGEVALIACGTFHTAVVLSDDRIFLWGLDSIEASSESELTTLYRLRLGPVNADDCDLTLVKPRFVEDFKPDSRIIQIRCGHWHNMVLTEMGTVFSWGVNETGQLGNKDEEIVDSPSPITALQGRKVVSISAGEEFACALDSSGRVWVWGKGDSGQLGLEGKLPPCLLEPTRIPNLPDAQGMCMPAGLDDDDHVHEEPVRRAASAQHQNLIRHGRQQFVPGSLSTIPANDAELFNGTPRSITFGHEGGLTVTAPAQKKKVYDQEHLLASMRSLKNCYSWQLMLRNCIAWTNWEAAACLLELQHAWPQALECGLRAVAAHDEQHHDHLETNATSSTTATAGEETTEQSLVTRATIMFHRSVDACIAEPEQQLGQVSLNIALCVVELAVFWEAQSLPLPLLETAMLARMSICASILCPMFDLGVGEFKNAEPSRSLTAFTILSSFSNRTKLRLARHLMGSSATSSIPRERLWTEIRHNVDKDMLARICIEVSAASADPPSTSVVTTPSTAGTATSSSTLANATAAASSASSASTTVGDATVSVFTCGHYFSRRALFDEILPELRRRLKLLPISMPSTFLLLTSSYQHAFVSAACPACAFNAIRMEQQKNLPSNASSAGLGESWTVL